MGILSKIKSKIVSLYKRLTFSSIKYWEERARKHGVLSVLNLRYNEEELKAVKVFQLETIFPLLIKELNGTDKTLLDFGCGPGRFSADLANATGCTVTGVDPIEHLLQLAPTDPRVSYKKLSKNLIPANNQSFDIIWICLVLGGITSKRNITKTIKELNRIAKKNSLLFLIENTAAREDSNYWKYRSISDYINLFKPYNLAHLKDYYDGDERISIFAGRLK